MRAGFKATVTGERNSREDRGRDKKTGEQATRTRELAIGTASGHSKQHAPQRHGQDGTESERTKQRQSGSWDGYGRGRAATGAAGRSASEQAKPQHEQGRA